MLFIDIKSTMYLKNKKTKKTESVLNNDEKMGLGEDVLKILH